MKIRSWRAVSVRSVLSTGLTIGLVAGLVVMIMSGLGVVLDQILHPRFPLMSQLVAGLALGLLLGLKHDLPGGLGADSSQELVTSRRKDRLSGLVAAVMIGLVTGLGLGLGFGFGFGFGFGAAVLLGVKHGLGTGLLVAVINVIWGALLGLIYGTVSSVRWPTTLAWLQLRLSRQIPAVDLMSFLEDARDREVLRTVGAVYQFRHATLQDQLAGQTTAPPRSL